MYLRWWSDYSKYSRILIFKSMSVISSPRICLTVEFLEWFESPIESTCEEDQLLRRPFDDSIVCCCFCCCCCCWRYCCCWTEGGISVRDFKQFILSQTLSGVQVILAGWDWTHREYTGKTVIAQSPPLLPISDEDNFQTSIVHWKKACFMDFATL